MSTDIWLDATVDYYLATDASKGKKMALDFLTQDQIQKFEMAGFDVSSGARPLTNKPEEIYFTAISWNRAQKNTIAYKLLQKSIEVMEDK